MITEKIPEGLTFDDVLLVPARSDVLPLNPKLLPAANGLKTRIATPDVVEKNRKHWDDVFRQLFR